MSWDMKDVTAPTPDSAADAPRALDPASPLMVPTLAVLHGLDDWLDAPLTLDTLPAAEMDDLRQYGITPPSQWPALRRLMTRGVVESG